MTPISEKFARGAMFTVVVLACTPSGVARPWGGGLLERLRHVDPLDNGADVRRGPAHRLHRGPGMALVATAR